MAKDRIENILENVNPSRRGFLKNILLGGGVVAALAIPASYAHAEGGAVGQSGGTGGSGKKKKKKADGDDKKN